MRGLCVKFKRHLELQKLCEHCLGENEINSSLQMSRYLTSALGSPDSNGSYAQGA